MQPTSQMLTRLQAETRSMHPDADSLWIELMSIEATDERYIESLVMAFGFEGPTEAALAMTPGVNEVLPLRPRARSGFIVEDLLALGFTPAGIARLPQCSHIVPFRDVSEAMGWVYVVERSTLLHESGRRHLETQLPSIRAWSYLSAYDGVTSERWQELGNALDATALNGSADRIIAGARAAFTTLHEWVVSEEAVAGMRAPTSHSVRPTA